MIIQSNMARWSIFGVLIFVSLFPHLHGASSGDLQSLYYSGSSADKLRESLLRPQHSAGISHLYHGEDANVSILLDKLMTGYDKRLRPNYHGKPVEVLISVYIISVGAVSEVNMDYTIDFYFRQHWQDPRLKHDETDDELCISNEMLEKLWWPDTFFANAKLDRFHTATTKNAFIRINREGLVTLSLRLTVTAMCNMDLTFFPMDSQICTLEIESYAYSVKHIAYKWMSDAVGMSKGMSQLQFKLQGYKNVEKTEVLQTGNYSRLALEFYFVRSLGYYSMHIYLPSTLIVVLSWVSFFLPTDSAPARAGLGITTVLTMTTLMSNTNSALPKISYLKSTDVYLVTCFVMVFAAILEFALVNYVSRTFKGRGKSSKGHVVEGGGGGLAELKAKILELEMQLKGCRLANHRKSSPGTPLSRTSSLPGSPCLPRWEPGHHEPPPGSPGSMHTYRTLPARGRHRMTSTMSSESTAPLLASSQTPLCSLCSCSHRSNHRHHNHLDAAPDIRPRVVVSGLGVSGGTRASAPPGKNPYVKLTEKIDRYSRFIFPVVFLAFNIIYWASYFNLRDSQPEGFTIIN